MIRSLDIQGQSKASGRCHFGADVLNIRAAVFVFFVFMIQLYGLWLSA
jgi:hypothetical protein